MRETHAGFNPLEAMRRTYRKLDVGSDPAIGEVLKLAAGVLLIIPGFLSDVIAIVLLVPPVRRWLSSKMDSGFPFNCNVRMLTGITAQVAPMPSTLAEMENQWKACGLGVSKYCASPMAGNGVEPKSSTGAAWELGEALLRDH